MAGLLGLGLQLIACPGSVDREPTARHASPHDAIASDLAGTPSVDARIPRPEQTPTKPTGARNDLPEEPEEAAWTPPRAGVYVYRSPEGAEHRVTVRVERLARGWRQTVETKTGSDEITSSYLWQGDEIRYEGRVWLLDGRRGACRFRQPVLHYRRGLGVGESWRADVSCRGSNAMREYRVASTDSVAIGNASEPCLTVEVNTTGESDTTGSIAQRRAFCFSETWRISLRLVSGSPAEQDVAELVAVTPE